VNPRRLYRSRNRQLAGVAGGMAEFLDIDPTIVRILWIVVGFASGGLALVAYIILALVIPQSPFIAGPGGWAPYPTTPGGWVPSPAPTTPPTDPGAAPGWTTPPSGPGAAWSTPAAAPVPGWYAAPYAQPQYRQPDESRGIGAAGIFGIVLIVIGAIALADAAVPGWIAGAIIGPAVIVALGAALLASSIRRHPEAPQAPAPAPSMAPAATTPNASAWSVTDTQAVNPAFAPAAGIPSSEPTAEGPHPA
jgi:phage shock protein C